MGIANVVSLLGGIALFLFGMTLMGDGLKKVAGNKLEMILWKLSSNPIKGVLLGTIVTAVIQSSSATTVMVVGFVNSGMMKVAQAIGIIMGANIGTSITGWIMCLSYLDAGASSVAALLSTATLSAIIAVVGIILRMFCKSQTKNHVGDIMLGFSVLMFGMQSMSSAVAPLKQSEAFVNLLTQFSNPFLGILIGILVTAVLQSASAAVGILQALSTTGAITFATAFPITMGIGIGAACPVLLSSIGANKDGKRTALIYLCNDLFGMIIWGTVFYSVNAFVHFDFMATTMGPVTIALLNTVFRVLTILVLMPFIKLLEKLVRTLIKDNPAEQEETAEIDRLEERFLAHPALAIEQSRLALNSMAHKANNNLLRAMSLLDTYDDAVYNLVQEKEDVVDRYEDKLGTYLVKITSRELNQEQSKESSKILHTMSDFERIGDHAVNVSKAAQEIQQKGITFSDEAKDELNVLQDAVKEILEIAIEAFEKEDVNMAYQVEPLEETIDLLCDEIKMRHINRIQRGECTLNHGFVFNDLLTNYERIADHCSNVAVAMIELEASAFDTHEYINSLHKIKNETFERYFEKYKNKYQL